MPSIFISGIPKGLDRQTASLRIKKDIETVAQVKTLWIQKEKGYGFVSLHDETSIEFVLSLNENISINGNALRLTRWKRTENRRPNNQNKIPPPTCKQQVNNDTFVLRGYDTYKSYMSHRPQTEVLYQYIQQAPKRQKRNKKPWKHKDHAKQLSSPKSRKTVRAQRRKCRKKSTRHKKKNHPKSPAKAGLCSTSQSNKRSEFNNTVDNLSILPTCFTKKSSFSNDSLESNIETGNINKNTLDSNRIHSSATVHVYDHSKRLCSIKVDNNNVLESIKVGLNEKQLPSDETILIFYRGKIVSSQWQPSMSDDDNIHIVVKGKGGMMQDDHPDDNKETANTDKIRFNEENAGSLQESQQKQGNSAVLGAANPDADEETLNKGNATSTQNELVEQMQHIPESIAEEAFHTSVQEQALQTNRTVIDRAGANAAESITKDTVSQSDVKHPLQSPVTGYTESSANESSSRQSVDSGLNTTLSLQQVIKSIPFSSTFSQCSEDCQTRLIEKLELVSHFPEKLTDKSVMAVSRCEKDEADTLADIPRLIVRKLLMLDYTSREDDLKTCLTKMKKSTDEPSAPCQKSNSSANEDYLSMFDDDKDIQENLSSNVDMHNPLDIFLSIFVCLHPSLKQKICLNMMACHLAIPFIFPIRKDEQHGKVLLLSMWPLRSIAVYDGQKETSLVNCKQNIVSFVRLGRPQISKSKLANEILYDTAHNTFFNYDCKLGSSEKHASVGLVEAAWFLPSPKQAKKIKKVTVFLNLRGDALKNAEQTEYLKIVSRVMIIVTDKEMMKNQEQMKYFKRPNFNVLFFLTGKVSNDFIRRYTEYYLESCPEGFKAQFIKGSEDDRIIGMSEIKESILNKIRPLLNDSDSTKTVQEICDQARRMGVTVDEDLPPYKRGRIEANAIFDRIKQCPLVDIKVTFTPLQTENWQKYTDAMKRYSRLGSDFQDKIILEEKMKSLRKQQWTDFKDRQAFMTDFISLLLTLDDNNLVSFLDSLKFELDEKFRTEIPYYRQLYDETSNKIQSTPEYDKTQFQLQLSKAEQMLSKAPFGIEHIFRELGQIYEASLMANESDLGPKLAKAVARSITLGYPFELMDGDVTNVPLKWIKAIFDELTHILGGVKLLTLSVLGLQSSGKSTLLNAMFGLTFSVSAGRCTRGIYVQLIPVEKKDFEFDYVLVVDTEGLRAPELGDTKYKHDNELATLVLGMADMTLFNIKGENTAEVSDILQICVHAFLRLKMVNHNLRLRQSCVFIHQNVPDINAKDCMVHARKKFDETLDRMAQDAAEEENISNINCFKDVIDFNSNNDVRYFGDLWKGDPPMAPANPGYSRDVREVRSFILGKLNRHKHSYLTIQDTFVHIKDLWNGILANDFVYSFRNSLEIKAYNALENKYQKLIWELEKFAKDILGTAEIDMTQFVAKACESDQVNDETIAQIIVTKYLKMFQEKALDSKTNLERHFDGNDKKDEIAQWKQHKMSSLKVFTEDLQFKIQTQLYDMQSNCKVEYKIKASFQEIKSRFYEKAKTLAEDLKGDKPAVKDMKKSFDNLWDDWVRQIDIQEESPVDIASLLEKIVYQTFYGHGDIVKTELNQNPFGNRKGFITLENSLNDFKFGNHYVSVKKLWNQFKYFVSDHVPIAIDRISKDIAQFTNSTLADMDTRFKKLEKKEWKFDEIEIKDILQSLIQHIDKKNQQGNIAYKLLATYKVKVAVHVLGHVLPLLERLDSEYKAKHSVMNKLQKFKDIAWRHFRDVVDEKSANIIACDRFCEVIKECIEETVRNNLSELIHRSIIEDIGITKIDLSIRLLEFLANKQKFNLYLEYINDPYIFAFEWLKHHIDEQCFQSPTYLYAKVGSIEVQTRINAISDNLKTKSASNLRDWLVDFFNKMRDVVLIPIESFELVMDQNVTNLDDFLTRVKEKLKETCTILKTKLHSETSKSVIWCKDETPYKKTVDRLWGCTEVCPFCHEPCKWNEHDSSIPHACIQHRPQGISGTRWGETKQLVLESCSYDVQSKASFLCSAICTAKECKNSDTTEKYHPYREYRKYIPDWDITPSPDIASSKYWAWVLSTFNEEFAEYYGREKGCIPKSWEEYTKLDAVKSLREYN